MNDPQQVNMSVDNLNNNHFMPVTLRGIFVLLITEKVLTAFRYFEKPVPSVPRNTCCISLPIFLC